MKIKISKTSMVGEIKNQFSAAYPFLKLEFLIRPKLSSGQPHPMIAPDNTMLSNIAANMKEGAIVLDDTTTVGELEAFFRNHVLDVQVFRQSDHLWLETTMTDRWTLEKQNTHGKEISEFKRVLMPATRYGNDIAGDAN